MLKELKEVREQGLREANLAIRSVPSRMEYVASPFMKETHGKIKAGVALKTALDPPQAALCAEPGRSLLERT